MSGKRYFWLKLPEDFFRRGYVRQMRRLPEGDRLTVIYLEMLLLGLKTGGELCYEGAEDPAEELALELFEPPEEVRAVLDRMTLRGKILPAEEGFFLTECAEMTGSEGSSAKRMRDQRRRERDAAPAASI